MATTAAADKTFPGFAEDDWRALVARSIHGRSVSDLAAKTDDGIAVGPLYGQREGGDVLAVRPPGPWTVVQRIDLPDVAAATEQIRIDLEGGAGAIELVLAGSPSARGAGFPALSDVDLDRLLASLPQGCQVRLDAGEATPALAERILDRGRPIDLTLAHDPIATLAVRGRLDRSFAESTHAVGLAAVRTEEMATTGAAILADGRLWHAGGASEVQELTAVLGAFVAYLRLFAEAGLSVERATRRIGVALAADADQFLTIAKFRAVRLLVGHALASAGIAPMPLHLHGETAWRMMTRRDMHTNLLRTTAAAFAAGVGGADSVTVLPFTVASGIADSFSRRVARNSQTILIAEAHLAWVADPAAGSGAVEALTVALAERAWAKFRAIEAAGGLLAAVRAGTVQREIGAMREARRRRIAAHEIELVGTTLFAEPGDLPAMASASVAVADTDPRESVEPLFATRLAEPFET